MRLIGASVVRNEADIVETFVRHNLATLDGLAVVDHGSTDGTSEILTALVREGLPLFVARDDSPEFDQKTMANRLVRHVFATSDAAWIFPLDADEFLKAPSREALESALDRVPAGQHVLVEWQTYVPDFGGALGIPEAIRTARRLARERHGFPKAAVSRHFVNAADRSLIKGNHGVVLDGPMVITVAGARLAPHVVALAHVPVRTAAQFSVKIAIGWLATLASASFNGGDSFHWRDAFAYLRSGRPLTPQQLASFAANYGVRQEQWLPLDAIELIDDPFLAAVESSYGHLARTDPLAQVLEHAEKLLTPTPASAPIQAQTTAHRRAL